MRWVTAKLVFIKSRINTLHVTPTQSGITKQESPSSNFQLWLATTCTYVWAGLAFSVEFTGGALSTNKFIPPLDIPRTSQFIHDAFHSPTHWSYPLCDNTETNHGFVQFVDSSIASFHYLLHSSHRLTDKHVMKLVNLPDWNPVSFWCLVPFPRMTVALIKKNTSK